MSTSIFKYILALAAVISATAAEGKTLGEVLFGSAKPKNNYIGQYADNQRDKTGTGMQLSKNGDLYIGDFVNGKHSGYGMYISSDGNSIKDLPGAVFYVGEWISNKKEGRGSCYAANGDLIYRGNFSDNKPVDPYPTPRPDETYYFTDIELAGDEYFIGEVRNGIPDGFGLFVLSDGTKSIGRVKSGRRTGLSLLIDGANEWVLVKWDNNGKAYTTVTTNSEFNARLAEYAAVKARINAELRASFMELLDEGMKLANDYMEMRQQTKGGSSSYSDDYSDTSSGGSSSSGSSKKSSSAGSKGNDCGSAWMNDKRAYSDYESQLAPNGARTATDESQRRSIKSKMKQIRQKWEKRGCPFTKSSYED